MASPADDAAALEGLERSEGWALVAERLEALRTSAYKQIIARGQDPVEREALAAEIRTLEGIARWPAEQALRLRQEHERSKRA